MTRNPFNNFFDSGPVGGSMPHRSYNPNGGGNPYVGQYRPDNYNPRRYQPSHNNRAYEYFANGRPSMHESRSRHHNDHDANVRGERSSRRRDRELDDRRVRFRDGSDSEIPPYELNRTSLRGEDGSSIRSHSHRHHQDTPFSRERTYRTEMVRPSHHTIYVTPRRRDAYIGLFSRGSRSRGRNNRRDDTDEDEIYRRVRHSERSSEQPRGSNFNRINIFFRR